MTTKNSPLHVLEAQAKHIARTIKEWEKGNPVDPRFKASIEAAKGRDFLSVGVVMDDKTLKLDMPWAVIREHTRDELAAWILSHMQERRETLN